MVNLIVVGMQWGDEGKGKIVDLLSPAFDGVVRYQGGHNAGHTVKFADRHFSLQLIPSGILHPGMDCVLGNGMVIAPDAFFTEVERLEKEGVRVEKRLFVSNRAHALLPPHALLDRARESAMGAGAIGTTARGIGPAYESKVSRYGLRLGELAEPDLETRLRAVLERMQRELGERSAEPLPHPARLADQCRSWSARLAPYLRDTEELLHEWLGNGRSLLFEGAQGTLLDVDHGTYPYVTSSNSTAGGACTGSGVPPTAIDGVLGIVKAYTTRVGGGPFPGELTDERGEYLRQRGNEFGTVTGRPRRCGWFDAVAVRYARQLNGTEILALTKLDVLDTLPEIPVCIAYRIDGREVRHLPSSQRALERAEPVFKVLKGWEKPTNGILDYEALPRAAREYVDFLEQQVDARIAILSTGPRREETIVRESPTMSRWLASKMVRVLAERSGSYPL
ncbi:MAG: adenylosuccinate synthase [Thermoanaerobaculia bacterium]